MDFEEKQQKNLTENQQHNEPDIRDLCRDVSYSCNHYSKKLDTMKMSKEIFDVYFLHVKILDFSNDLWQNFLKLITRENKFHVEDLCCSIINPENCDGLNKFYHSFNIESREYMKDYIGPQSHDDYLGLVKKLFTPFDFFLQLSLPSLEKSIKSLLFVIDMPDGNGSFKYDYYKTPFIGDVINLMILKYLRQLQDLFLKFKLVRSSSELIEKKEQIESRIKRAIEANLEILKKNKLMEIVQSSTTSTTEPEFISTFTISNFNSSISPTISSSTSLKLTTSSTSSKTTNTMLNKPMENYFYQPDVTFGDNVTKPKFKITENPNFIGKTTNLSNNVTNFKDITKLSNNTLDNLPGDQSSVVFSKSVTNWIIFGSVFSVIGLSILIAFSVKKYISRRKRSRDNISIRLNNEKFNSVAFDKY